MEELQVLGLGQAPGDRGVEPGELIRELQKDPRVAAHVAQLRRLKLTLARGFRPGKVHASSPLTLSKVVAACPALEALFVDERLVMVQGVDPFEEAQQLRSRNHKLRIYLS